MDKDHFFCLPDTFKLFSALAFAANFDNYFPIAKGDKKIGCLCASGGFKIKGVEPGQAESLNYKIFS